MKDLKLNMSDRPIQRNDANSSRWEKCSLAGEIIYSTKKVAHMLKFNINNKLLHWASHGEDGMD